MLVAKIMFGIAVLNLLFLFTELTINVVRSFIG